MGILYPFGDIRFSPSQDTGARYSPGPVVKNEVESELKQKNRVTMALAGKKSPDKVTPLHSEERKMRRSAKAASGLLKSLANENRLMILCMLAEREMSVNQISEYVDLGQSALSQHLAKLRAEGLVKTRKSSQNVFYSLDSKEAAEVIKTLYGLYCK